MLPMFSRGRRFILVFMLLCMLLSATISPFLFVQPLHAQVVTPKLSIQFTCVQAVDHRSGMICVHTQARAALTITVRYCTGSYATSNSLKGTQYADTRGDHTWSWVPDTKCRGAATAYVSEHWNGHSWNASRNFSVN